MNTSAPIRLKNHILQQLFPDIILLEFPRDAPKMTECNRSARATGEELKGDVDIGLDGVVILYIFRCELGGRDGQERWVGDETGRGRIDGGEDGGEFG